MVRIKPKPKGSRHISKKTLSLRQQELRIMQLIEEAKSKVRIKNARGQKRLKIDKDSSKYLQELVERLKREGFTCVDIVKIVRPLFPEDVPLQNIYWIVIRKSKHAEARTEKIQRSETSLRSKYKTLEEKHEEALIKNRIFDMRKENPDIGVREIAKRLGLQPHKVREYLKELQKSVDMQTTKELFSTKHRRRRKRINAFSVEEKWDIIQRNMGIIKKFAAKGIGVPLQRADFEDLISEVIVRLFISLDYFDPKGSAKVSTFLANEAQGVASHTMSEFRAKERRKREYLHIREKYLRNSNTR